MSTEATSEGLPLYDLDGNVVAHAALEDGEVVFPDDRFDWTWILDARHAPYDELELETLVHRAEHVRKRFILRGAESS